MTMRPKVLIPVALGTNRDADLARAFELAGADPECVPLTALRSGERSLPDYQMLAIPGGFSYGDALGAGRLLGLDLQEWFGDQLVTAQAGGMPIFGVCNGFQALVRAGLLPGQGHEAVLVENESARFECRWVTLVPGSSRSPWLDGLSEPIRCPVAHGEGRFVAQDLAGLEAAGQIAFRYDSDVYPSNPNGSTGAVAGICDPTGLILGLMPHPENHVLARQDPQRGRGEGRSAGGLCLRLFRAGVAAVGG